MAVLISYLAVKNDSKEIVEKTGTKGPSVHLLTSEYAKQKNITKVVFLYNADDKSQKSTYEYVKYKIEKKSKLNITVDYKLWEGNDPTDHKNLYLETRRIVKDIYESNKKSNFIVHISPGTSTMHAVWLLLSETKEIQGKYELVKSFEKSNKVTPVDIHKEIYEDILSMDRGAEDRVFWDESKFRTEKLKTVFKNAEMYAKIKAPILILGERGTGKTTLAKWIRNKSPFVNQNIDSWPTIVSGQYTEELMRSELFGYEKGSFTGANDQKEGLLKKLDGDTLFLDEIADMPQSIQRFLIRAIEEKQFSPIGSSKDVKSDFRIITATNIPLKQLKEKLFLDFYDRISIFKIEIPPLRKIKEELDWLWEEVFTNTKRKAVIANDISISEESHAKIVKVLQGDNSYISGNIRDLALIAYNIYAFLTAKITEDEAVKLSLEQYLKNQEKIDNNSEFNSITKSILDDSIELEKVIKNGFDTKKYIEQLKNKFARTAMNLTNNNKKKSAKLLGLKDGKSIDKWTS